MPLCAIHLRKVFHFLDTIFHKHSDKLRPKGKKGSCLLTFSPSGRYSNDGTYSTPVFHNGMYSGCLAVLSKGEKNVG